MRESGTKLLAYIDNAHVRYTIRATISAEKWLGERLDGSGGWHTLGVETL